MIWDTARFVLDVFGAAAIAALVALGVAQLRGNATITIKRHESDEDAS